MAFFNFWNFFAIFFGIFYYALDRNGMELKFLFSLFLNLYRPILARNEAIMLFFNFLKILVILMEFSITLRAGTKRNDNFYFHFFIFTFSRPFPIYFGSKWSHNCIFWIFWIFFYMFWSFYIRRRIGTKRNDKFYFLFFKSFSILFWLEM